MFKIRYSQKVGILISLVILFFVLSSFSIYYWVFSNAARSQARNKMVYEVTEVLENFITIDANKNLVLSKDSSEIVKDLTRDRLSLAIYNKDLSKFQSYGIFSEPQDINLFSDENAFLSKLEFSLTTNEPQFYTLINPKLNERYELLISPIKYQNEIVGVITLISPIEQIEWMLNFSKLLMISIIPVVLLISYFFGLNITKKAYKPISSVIRRIKSANTKNLEKVELEGHPEDESYLLASEYNSMVDRLKDGITKQNMFISNASHELRTPLARLQSYIDLIEDKSLSEDMTVQILEFKDRIEALTNLANLKNISPTKINTKEVYEVIDSIKEKFKNNLDRISFEIDEDISYELSSTHLKIILENLISNAVKYSDDIINVTLKTNYIKVEDKGIGINNYDLKYITQPFFRSNKVNGIDGNGLGLTLVKGIIDEIGGLMLIESEEGKGTSIEIKIKNGAI